MKKIRQLIFLFTCFCLTSSFSQIKFEREFRISEHAVPILALEFIQQAELDLPVKWYVEQSQEGKSYEAKTTVRKHQLSIEFNSQGLILDIEKRMHLSELSSAKSTLITKALTDRFKKFKLKKIQAHWEGSEEQLLTILKSNSPLAGATHFEIVLRSKTDKEHYEVLLTAEGNFSKVLKIVPGSFDNLEY